MTQVLIDLNRKYTSAEFEKLQLPDDGQYELVEGKIVMAPSAGDEHNTIAGELYVAIKAYAKGKKVGKVWYETDFILNENNTRRPDVAFIVHDRVPPTGKGSVLVPPDLAVEVWSGSDLDTKNERDEARAKIQLYQDTGVRLIWAINPRNKTVLVFHPDTTNNPIELNADQELEGEEIIPGFTLPINTLFEYEY